MPDSPSLEKKRHMVPKKQIFFSLTQLLQYILKGQISALRNKF